MEIVSEPDIRSAEEAVAFMRKLRSILRYLGTCDGNMEEGNLRCDANVSVRRPGDPLGTRCEVKNLNSMRFVGRAIEHEAKRQVELIEAGGTVEQETRLFDAERGETRSMRTKEEAHDYRYFPDPDLLPLELDEAFIAAFERTLPELPDAKKARFMRAYGLSAYDAEVLVAEKASADYFEAALAPTEAEKPRAAGAAAPTPRDPKLVANWLLTELFGALNRAGRDLAHSPITPDRLGALVDLIQDGTISGRIAKDVFSEMFETGADPAAIVEQKGLKQISDASALERVAERDHRRQPRSGRKAAGQPQGLRLVRRPGDEGDPGPGQPPAGQRGAAEEAGRLNRRPGLDIARRRQEIPTMRERRPIESRFVTSRLGVKSQTVVPKEVREALGVGPGDQIGYSIQNGRVILTAVERPVGPGRSVRLFRRMGVRGRYRGLCLFERWDCAARAMLSRSPHRCRARTMADAAALRVHSPEKI